MAPVVESGYVNIYALDITRLKRAEQALRLQSEVATNMSEGVILIRATDNVIIYANPRLEEMFGYGSGEMIGKHVSILNSPTDKSPGETAREIIAALVGTGVWRLSLIHI